MENSNFTETRHSMFDFTDLANLLNDLFKEYEKKYCTDKVKCEFDSSKQEEDQKQESSQLEPSGAKDDHETLRDQLFEKITGQQKKEDIPDNLEIDLIADDLREAVCSVIDNEEYQVIGSEKDKDLAIYIALEDDRDDLNLLTAEQKVELLQIVIDELKEMTGFNNIYANILDKTVYFTLSFF